MMSRRPLRTASWTVGTSSASLRSAIVATGLPSSVQTSVFVGNRSTETRYENGRCTDSTSSRLPSGEGRDCRYSAGAPIGVTLPSTVTTAICDAM